MLTFDFDKMISAIMREAKITKGIDLYRYFPKVGH